MSRRSLQAEIAAAQRRRARAAAQVAAEDARLASLIDARDRQRTGSDLSNQHERATVINTMDMPTQVRGARLSTKHIGARRIREVDKSVARFAAKHKVAATTVRSWYATGDAAREIPRPFADLLSKEPYLIPLSAWRNGIGE